MAKKKVKKDKIQEYFDGIKAKVDSLTLESLQKQLKELPGYIETAKKNGQVTLVKKLQQYLIVMIKEKVLLDNNITKVVHLDDIVRYIDSIPQHYVKFCELEIFPRIIPNDVSEKIQKCKEKGLFDEYYVLFTDYIDQELLTKEQKEEREKNKDPIVFGAFKDYEERYYYIADWIDEYCDITFDKFVMTLQDIDPNYKPREIIEDTPKYINDFLQEIDYFGKKKELSEEEIEKEAIVNPVTKTSWFNRMLNRLFN